MCNLLFTREDLAFDSRGTRCAAWLYRPEGVEKPPVVVMAHGFGAQRDFGLPAYAERFARRGMAVFLFDYRNFGASEGEPRNLVSNSRHLRDWEAALSCVRGLPGIDTGRMGLWGSSFSGGHVIVTAARDAGVSAIVSQVPFVDGITTAYWTGIRHAAQATVAGVKDVLRMITAREPYCVPIVSGPDVFGLMNSPECEPGYMAIVPEETDWINACPARAVLELLLYRPVSHARGVCCPALVMMGEKDSLIYARSVEKTASRMREVTLIHLPVGHFDIYVGDWFEKTVEIQAEFLARHLQA
ncbi:MAG: alpha/beta fold hydrolase [Actinobacteria bacterium]|jgi:dienelactone hydrolase|nr:MAG: alpha/beta fold hydrolase [Actinomycetota bacterium]